MQRLPRARDFGKCQRIRLSGAWKPYFIYLPQRVCARFPFFSPGIAALSCEVISREKSRRTDLQEIHGIGTDGSRILADPMFLIRVWEKNPGALKRGYLHILFHCLYLHPFSQEKANKRLWNLACDLAAELLLKENIPEDLWGFSAEEKKLRGRVLEFLDEGLYLRRYCTIGLNRRSFRFPRRKWSSFLHLMTILCGS